MTKKKRKQNARSLANLVPGGNLRSGAYLYRRTGRIPPGHQDIAEEARRFEKDLNQYYCQPGNMILSIVQAVPIRQLVSGFVFSELLITHLWQQVNRAGPDGMGAALSLPGWMTWLAETNRIRRGFRELQRNLQDFRFGKEKKSDLDDYLERTYGDKGRK